MHYRTGDGSTLCGLEGPSTLEPWSVSCRACFDVAAAESLDQPTQPHPFRWPSHCATCNGSDPVRAWRRDARPWNGAW